MEIIINSIQKFISSNGQYYDQFYIGIATNPRSRLIDGHGITKETPCIYSTDPLPAETVRAIEKYFIAKGTKGGDGGGDCNTRYIYCYKICPWTRP